MAAGVAGATGMVQSNMEKFKGVKNKEEMVGRIKGGGEGGGGDGSHSHGGSGAPMGAMKAIGSPAPMASPNKSKTMASPNKNHAGGVGKYTPYKMAAHGHNNSPIDKNYGDAAKRGHSAAAMKSFDVPNGLNEETVNKTPTSPGALNMGTAGGVGSSPAKGFWGSVGNVFSGGLSGRIKKRRAKRKAAKEAKAAAAAEAAGANAGGGDMGGGDGAHSHGGGGEAMATAGGVGGDAGAMAAETAAATAAPEAPVANVAAAAAVPGEEEVV